MTMTITEIIKSLNDPSFQIGEFQDLEIWTNDASHVVMFDGSFDKKETYVIDATYFEPKEIGIEESKEISNVKLLTNDMYWGHSDDEKVDLTPNELDRLTKAIKSLIYLEY